MEIRREDVLEDLDRPAAGLGAAVRGIDAPFCESTAVTFDETVRS